MAQKAVVALGFAVLVLFSVFAVPSVLDSRADTEVSSMQVDAGDTGFFGNGIEVAVADSSNTLAEIIIVDEETGESDSASIAPGANYTASFSNGDVTVTNTVSTQASATLLVEYKSTYGYSGAALTVIDNLDIILIAMILIAVMGFVGVKP